METDGDGFKYIFKMVDSFAKFVILRVAPTRSVDVEGVLNMLETLIDIFSVPKRIIADRGGAFSKSVDEFCVLNGIQNTSQQLQCQG